MKKTTPKNAVMVDAITLQLVRVMVCGTDARKVAADLLRAGAAMLEAGFTPDADSFRDGLSPVVVMGEFRHSLTHRAVNAMEDGPAIAIALRDAGFNVPALQRPRDPKFDTSKTVRALVSEYGLTRGALYLVTHVLGDGSIEVVAKAASHELARQRAYGTQGRTLRVPDPHLRFSVE